MARLVAFGIVRVHRVGVVRRHAGGSGERPDPIAVGPATRLDQSVDHVLEEWPGRSRTGSTSRPLRGRSSRSSPRGRTVRRPAAPSPRPSTRAGCRAARTTAASGRHRAPTRPARRRATAPTMPARAEIPARSPIQSAKSPTAGKPTPHTGLRCCCVSRSNPTEFTSRSRCTASCGTRAIGSRTSTSVGRAVVGDEPTGDAEVAVEPRVVEDAAVHLDGELLPPEAAGVGVRLDPQARRIGVAPDEPERQRRRSVAPSGKPPRDQGRVADDETGRRHVGPGVALVEPFEAGQTVRSSTRRRARAMARRRGRRSDR